MREFHRKTPVPQSVFLIKLFSTEQLFYRTPLVAASAWRHLSRLATVVLKIIWVFNPLQPGVAFLYPLKTLENLKVTPGCNGLKVTDYVFCISCLSFSLSLFSFRAQTKESSMKNMYKLKPWYNIGKPTKC